MWNKECVSASFSAPSGFAGAVCHVEGHTRGQIQAVLSVLLEDLEHILSPRHHYSQCSLAHFHIMLHTMWAFRLYWLTGLCCPFPSNFYSLIPWVHAWFCRRIAPTMEHKWPSTYWLKDSWWRPLKLTEERCSLRRKWRGCTLLITLTRYDSNTHIKDWTEWKDAFFFFYRIFFPSDKW